QQHFVMRHVGGLEAGVDRSGAEHAAHPSGGTCCSRRAWASQVFPVAQLALRHPLDGGFETARSRFLGARVGDPVDVFAPHALAEASYVASALLFARSAAIRSGGVLTGGFARFSRTTLTPSSLSAAARFTSFTSA